jgi:uncharacterized protein YkwD
MLLGKRGHPSVEVVDAGGVWRQVPTSVSVDGRFAARVQCRGRGVQQVEVLADGAHGPEVAANFPVSCGGRPPEEIHFVIERVADSVTADQIARARRGLPVLQWDDAAAGIAVTHSQDMARSGFVGHRSPSTGDVTARFRRAGVKGVLIRENVARGYGPKGIHDSLMNSPGHRVNMLAGDVTHVGIGAVLGPAETDVPGVPRPVFATQNFYRKPGATAPRDDAQLPGALQKKVDAARAAAGLSPVQWDDSLSKIAGKYAPGIAAGRRPPKTFETEVFALGYKAVDTHQFSSPDFDALAGAELFMQPVLRAGIGVVRTRKGGETHFVAILLLGER